MPKFIVQSIVDKRVAEGWEIEAESAKAALDAWHEGEGTLVSEDVLDADPQCETVTEV